MVIEEFLTAMGTALNHMGRIINEQIVQPIVSIVKQLDPTLTVLARAMRVRKKQRLLKRKMVPPGHRRKLWYATAMLRQKYAYTKA